MASVPPPPYQIPQPIKKSNTALIVVIVVLAFFCLVVPVLAAILFPVFSQAKLSARRSVAVRQASQITQYLMIYATDNDNRLPHDFVTDRDLNFAVVIYAGGPYDMFDCHNPNGGVFMPNSELAGIDVTRIISPESAVLVFESAPWDGGNGRVVGYVNGRVEYIKPFAEAQMLPTRLLEESPQAP